MSFWAYPHVWCKEMELETDQGCWVVAEIIMLVAGETNKQKNTIMWYKYQ